MNAAPASSQLRAVFEVARCYAAGTSSVHELNGAVSVARTWARSEQMNPAVLELLDEWHVMVNRRWNEWGLEKEPISEEQFRAWLQEQLIGGSPTGHCSGR